MTFNISNKMVEEYLDQVFVMLAKRVGITENQHNLCATHFRGITSLLDNSELKRFKPMLRIQGSNRLGTAIRSASNEINFDVDIVIELFDIPSDWTPYKLKEEVGRILKSSDRYAHLIKPANGGKRCWTIEFADGTHADILPASANDEYRRIVESTSFGSFNQFEIRITDKTILPDYYYETDRLKWMLSNPIGFAEWFFAMARYHEVKHKAITENLYRASIEPFPKWKLDALTLQYIVRLLKRHRDMMFGDDKEKPISMIITVLAAKAYCLAPSGGIFSTMLFIADNLVSVMDKKDGRNAVLNPVNSEEDFTDRWRKTDAGQREQKFYDWVRKLANDLHELCNMEKVRIGKHLKKIFGESAGSDAILEYARKEQSESSKLKMTTSGTFSSTAGVITARNNTFFGKCTKN